jgi:hypothetical protein
LPEYLEAAARAAIVALERGELAEARRLWADPLRAPSLQNQKSAQVKLLAKLTSPEPLYFGHFGYSHNGRVRPAATAVSVMIWLAGAIPSSTQFSSAVTESQPGVNAALRA